MAHEMAHCFFNQQDEYDKYISAPDNYKCGHTLMSNAIESAICTEHNHPQDFHPNVSPSQLHPGWYYASQAGGNGSWVTDIPLWTPDLTWDGTHDFSGSHLVVVQH